MFEGIVSFNAVGGDEAAAVEAVDELVEECGKQDLVVIYEKVFKQEDGFVCVRLVA